MRHSIKRISKSALSVILALMMVVSTMVVGMVTVGAASVTSDGNAILYFNRSAVSGWPATGNFVYFYNSSVNKWSENATQYSGDTYYVKIPEGTWTNCILTRNSVTSNPSWGNKINQTGDISLSSDNNYISSFSEGKTEVTWSTIKPASTFTLSVDNTTVDAGTTVNFSTTIASNSTYNDITSNSLSVTGGSSSDYSINGTSITFNNAGTYTVKNTVTYNPKGYTSITSTADTSNTVTVTVNSVEKNYYVAGTSALANGENWSANSDKNKMTKNDDGTYSITYINLDPKSDDTYQFKITNGTWTTSYGYNDVAVTTNAYVTASNSGGNIKLTFETKSNITITIDPNDNNKISIVATPVVSDYTISVAARYQSYDNEQQKFNDVTTEIPAAVGAIYKVNDGDSGASATVSSGTAITLSASTTDTTNYEFEGWYANENCTDKIELDESNQITPASSTNYYALFRQNTSKVTYKIEGSDSATINGNGNNTEKTYSVGTNITVTPSDVTGYSCSVSVDGATYTDNEFTVGTSAITVTATYSVNNYTLTCDDTITNGSLEYSGSASVAYNSDVTVKVIPAKGYKVKTVSCGSAIISLSDPDTNGVRTATFKMPASNVTFSAEFTKESYTITDSSVNGSVQPKVNGTDSYAFSIDDKITFEPKPADGYKWTSYTVTFSDSSTKQVYKDEAYELTIDASNVGNITVTGAFTEDSFEVSFAGDHCTLPTATTAVYKSNVTIPDFDADSGYVITGYTVTKTGDSSTNVTVTDNSFTMPPYEVTVTAIVKKQHTVTATSDANGSVSPENAKVTDGDSVTFTATPNDGYVVEGWYSDSTYTTKVSDANKTYTFTPTADTDVYVKFTDKPKFSYALVGNGGAITDSNGNAVDWHGKDAATQADFALSYQSALKFTNNKLVVKVSGITDKNVAQFRFLGTDGTNYYHYGSNDNNNKAVASGSTYTTTQTNMAVYKFTENGTYEIEITSGTDSPMSFKVTKLATYYIGGRFKVKASEDATTFTYTSTNSSTNNWSDTSTVIPFTYVGDGLYKLDTYCTIKELSEQISNNSPYFLIHDGTTKFVSNVSKMHDMEDHNESRKVTLKKFSSDTTDDYLLFSDTSSTDTSLVTLYLDTTGTNLQIYYVADGGKTALDAPSITTNVESLSTEKPTATITVTPADTYPKGMAVEYYLYNGGTYVNKTAGTTFTVTSAGTYTVKAYPPADNPDYKESVDSNPVVISDVRTPVVLKAMHGIKNGEANTGNTVAEAANTSSSVVVNTGANLAGGIQYTVTKGSTVKLTTTMVADTTTAEKFVYAYVVNNKDTYLATEGIAATGEGDKKYATYSATFTIDEDATDTTFTVVPIYYYKACGKDGEYIKFYVNPKESNWTNGVYNYAYYYPTKEGESKQESDGAWPGQPMLYDETKQLYYSLVPKKINNQPVSGLTVNNNGSEQTYDFDDFKYIYESGYDIVRLDLKYRSGHGVTERDKGNGVNKIAIGAGQTETGGFAAPTKTITESTFDGRWESFNDINGNPMSLLGKKVTDTNKVYVVSTALYNISDRGEFMTSWYVYKSDSNGNLTFVTAACPSDFVPRPYSGTQTELDVNTDAYKAVLNAGLGNSPVQIVYEDVQFKSSKDRFDGRWYYAQSDSEVSAYAYYRTTDSDGTNPSKLIQNAAYASVNGAVSVTNPKLGLEVSVVSSPLAGYIFDHWSVVDKAGNTLIEKLDNVGASFTTTLDQEVHYVANFRKATLGQLVINHSKYTGTDAKNGLGFYRLEVQVQKENGSWTSVYAGSGTGANGQTVTISELSENDKIVRIKLITETAGENTFRYWYTRSSDGMEIIEDPDGDMTHNGSSVTAPTGLNGTLTYTFETEVWKLFRDNKQIINQMNFYSDIAPMTKNYKLTYIYDDRFGNQKSYVVTGTHDDSYYVKNENSWAPNEELIYEKAPFIDDLYKDCTWTMTQCTTDGTDATLIADQKNKKYTVDIYDSTGEAYVTYQLAINSYVKNGAGQFYVADEFIKDGDTEKEFSYWAVYERIVDAQGKVTQGKEVARHYYRKYTLVVLDNYIIKPVYGEKVEDKAYISDPQYSREQTTNADGSVVKDKLYVDFMLAYISSTNDLIRNDLTGEKYKTGILIEVDKSVTLNEGSSDYSDITFESSRTNLENIAKTTTTKNTYTYTNSDSTTSDRIVFNYRATNTNYNNMNRLEYFVYFNNTEANCSYVMKAYYYVIVDGTVILSDPVFFNLYEVGNSDPNTVTTTS